MALTAEQQAVVDISAGRHLVLAPPGTGKTQMLTERVKLALAHGARPEDMLCGTFTIRAAAEMRERIRTELGVADEALPLIGNLHHICHRFLFGNRLVSRNRQIVDGNFRDEALGLLLRQHPAPKFFLERHYQKPNGQIDRFGYDRDYADAVNLTLALRSGTPTEFMSIRKNPCVGDTFVDEVCTAYAKLKEDLFVLDFDDLLVETYKALKAGKTASFRKYRWIQIDEVQDLSPLQWAIVDEMAAEDAVLVFFGDYEQSIYSFLGASTYLLDRKAEACQIHFFETNFRAPSYLLDLLSRYSFRTLGSSFSFLPFPAQYESGRGHLRLMAQTGMDGVAAEAAAMLDAGATDSVAILVQTNQQADEAEQSIQRLGVPYVKVSGFEFGSRKIFRDLAALMDVVANPLARVGWSRLVRHFAGRAVKSQAEAQAVVSELFALRLDPRDVLDDTTVFGWRQAALSLERYGEYATGGRIVVFDTETTGLDVRADHIVQLTGVEYVKGVRGRQLNLFLRSPVPMPAAAEAVHHISDARLAEVGIDPADGIRRFLAFAGGDLLVAHNLNYDRAMLANACARYGIPFDPAAVPMCDTLLLCRRLHPELTVYKLGTLLEQFGLEGSNSHDALDDVLAAGNLFLHLAREGMALAGRQRRWLEAHAPLAEAFAASATDYFARQKARLDGPFDLRTELRAFIDYSRDPDHPLYTPSDCRRMLHESRVGEADEDGEAAFSEGEEVATEELMRPLDKLFDYLEQKYADEGRPFRQVIEEDWDEITKLREADLIPDDARLVVSSIHKAKGRQFDTVFIPYCQDSQPSVYGFPSPHVKFYHGDRAENKRLLYVGMSRARRNLILASTTDEISPYLNPCLECFAPDFKDFYTHVRENGGKLYAFGEHDWLARLYFLILCKRDGREPPQLRAWLEDTVPCIRKIAFQFLPRCRNAALVDEVLTAALGSGSAFTLACAVATVKRMRAVQHLRALRLKMLQLPAAASVKGEIIGTFAACWPDPMAVEGLEDAVFEVYGPFRVDAARRLEAFGQTALASVVKGTDEDWQALARLATPRQRGILSWRVEHGLPGHEIIRQVLRMAESASPKQQ